MMDGVRARGEALGEAAARRLAARVRDAADGLPGVTATNFDGGVVLEGRGLGQRVAGDLRWIGGLVR